VNEKQIMKPLYIVGSLSLVWDQVITRMALGLGALELHPLTAYLLDHRLWLLYDVANILLMLHATRYASRTYSWIIFVPFAFFSLRLGVGLANAVRLLGVA